MREPMIYINQNETRIIKYIESTGIIMRIESIDSGVMEESWSIVEVSKEDIDKIIDEIWAYKFVDGKFVKDENLIKEHCLNLLRDKRATLLSAFDIYKSNLIVGILNPTEEEKEEILNWYNRILDLDEDAINNVPSLISKYL